MYITQFEPIKHISNVTLKNRHSVICHLAVHDFRFMNGDGEKILGLQIN